MYYILPVLNTLNKSKVIFTDYCRTMNNVMHIWVPTTQLKKWNSFITFEAPLQVFPDPVSLANETKSLIFITCVHFSFKFCHMDVSSSTAYWWIHIVCIRPQLSFLHSLLYPWDGAMLVADCSFHSFVFTATWDSIVWLCICLTHLFYW